MMHGNWGPGVGFMKDQNQIEENGYSDTALELDQETGYTEMSSHDL